MNKQTRIVIAALMITSIAFAVSTTSVSATHTPTATIDKDTVKAATIVLAVTVGNAGPDPIETVRIVFPSGWSPATVVSIPEDNLVDISGGLDDNLVVIPAGTVIVLDNENAIWLYENTEVRGIMGSIFCRDNVGNENAENVKFSENATMKVKGIENFFAYDNENIAGVSGLKVTLENGLLRLAEDTLAVRADDNIVWFPSAVSVELIAENWGTTNVDNEDVVLQQDVLVRSRENVELRLLESVRGLIEGGPFNGLTVELLPTTDENLTLYAENDLLIPAGTTVFIRENSRVKLAENTEVTIPAENRAEMENAEAAENRPANWTQDNTETYLEWGGDENHQIAKGKSLDFPFAVTTSGGGEYTLYVRTEDTKGVIRVSEITLTVDNVLPEVEIDVSPDWVKGGTTVAITVTASETLAKLDNVMVAENNATENTQVTMSPNADKTVWTGTYTTGDNENRDGTANVYVFGFEDLFGNEGDENTATFTVDRMAPPAPVLDDIPEFPDSPTNIGEWLLENNALDNLQGVLETQKGMTVEIRVGDTLYTKTTADNGYWYYQLTLLEGTNEVGIRFVDKAGNEGTENAENITYDATKPSISITSPENGEIINDNTPTIKLTISDVVMGIENTPYYENHGYSVQLCYDNGDLYGEDNLTPKTYPTEDPINSFVFENDYPTELAENWYRIYVVAGDNLQPENVYFRFEVDVTAPDAPTVTAGSVLHLTTAVKPYMMRETSISISGDGDPGDTVNIYLNDETTPTKTAKVTSAGMWSAKISLTGGHVTKISVSETDVAGNESAKQVWGYAMSDAIAPAVTLAALPGTTDETSVILSGTVDKDDWEDWSDITLTAQVGIGSVEVQIGAGGGYSCSVPLSMGVNTIVVRATDSVGNAGIPATATVERVFTMDTTAPSVTLEALPETTDKASITISGTVSKDAGEDWSDITLTVQVGTGRVEVPIGAGGSYSYSVGLAEGPNTIAVQATDGVGNTGTAAYAMVERTVTPWGTYAIILVIVALVMAAIAIFRKKR